MYCKRLILCTAVLLVSIRVMAAGKQADMSEPSLAADDCTQVNIDFNPKGRVLTEAEKTALMDRAFYESLSRFDRCQSSASGNGGGSAGAANGGGGGGSAGDGSAGAANDGGGDGSAGDSSAGAANGDSGTEGAVDSVAAASVSGTESAAADAEAQSSSDEGDDSVGDEGQTEQTALASPSTLKGKQLPSGGGKAPEDIPPADNDSVLEAQIRAAAMAEKDPQTKARLWNEYRKYKGLPQVKAAK